MIRYIFLLIFTIATVANSQVIPSKPFVFMNKFEKQGLVTLKNETNTNKEVEISLGFFYPSYDSLGNKSSKNVDEKVANQYSIIENLKVFPKKILLKPKSQQDVKVLFTGNKTFEPGSYWARLIVKSREMKKELENTESAKKLNVGIILTYETHTLIMYQEGELTASAQISSPKIVEDTSGMKLVFQVDKEGNSPLWARIKTSVYERATKQKINELNEIGSIYTDQFYGVKLDASKLKRGEKYNFEVELTDERGDIPVANKCQFAPVKKQFELVVPELKLSNN